MVRRFKLSHIFSSAVLIYQFIDLTILGLIDHCTVCYALEVRKLADNELASETVNGKYKGDSIEFYFCIIFSILLIFFGGIVSGLTTGLMSLDNVQLRVLIEAGNENEKKWASTALGLIKRHHLLLVTLLLANSICMEALPLFLDRIIPSWVAIISSVTAILIFGEILPQAICTGKHQLRIAASCATFVRCLIICLFIFSWPLSKVLDYFIGENGKTSNFYARGQLKALIALHRKSGDFSATPISVLSVLPKIVDGQAEHKIYINDLQVKGSEERLNSSVKEKIQSFYGMYFNTSLFQTLLRDNEGFYIGSQQITSKTISNSKAIESCGLANDEVTIIQGVLDMANKSLLELSVPLEKVYMLHIDSKLDHLLLEDILRVGHSRIPIYSENRHNIKGLLLVKSLITIDPDDSITIKSLFNSNASNRYIIEPIFTSPDTNPYDALNIFQQGRCHIAILTNYVEEYTYSTKTNTPLPDNCEIIGIATLEDIIEEIIQEEIIDEFDKNQPNTNIKNNHINEKYSIRKSSSFFRFDRSLGDYLNGRFNYSKHGYNFYRDNFVSAPELWNPIYYGRPI
ncbi:cyclin M2-like membrane-associated protein [Cryptosporidium canis]|uniref:Cyclin M2-like membrane-associated protein n=1 Tax=Cryptosporidium canis TaxID=195482 RepID=A0A9D5DL38_9CRYT|nr:cyclin M2-like membrane-associated protein [Cryptosporidium canis]